jgi:hypothetical protein
MLLSWIVKTIPRSWRALAALLIMLGSVGVAFTALQELFLAAGASTGDVVLRLAIGLIVGLPATAVFYYFQTMDDYKRHSRHELEILNDYADAARRDRVYKESRATPAFTSHDDPARPKSTVSQK